MSKAKKKAVVEKECVACGVCVKHCPLGAISIYKGVYALPNEKCVGCGRCQTVCPADVIKIMERGVTLS